MAEAFRWPSLNWWTVEASGTKGALQPCRATGRKTLKSPRWHWGPRATSHMSQEPWPWNCESPKQKVSIDFLSWEIGASRLLCAYSRCSLYSRCDNIIWSPFNPCDTCFRMTCKVCVRLKWSHGCMCCLLLGFKWPLYLFKWETC